MPFFLDQTSGHAQDAPPCPLAASTAAAPSRPNRWRSYQMRVLGSQVGIGVSGTVTMNVAKS
jgi:hypothetical protein